MSTSTGQVAQVVTEAWDLHQALLRGEYSAIVDFTPGRWTDPGQARGALDAAAAVAAVPAGAPGEGQVNPSGGDHVEFTGTLGALSCAVEAWERLQLGQFSHLGVTYAHSWEFGEELARVRVAHARQGAWPEHPGASWGIRSPEVPDGARVAYDIWKLLGCGIPERGVICGTVVLHADPAPAATG